MQKKIYLVLTQTSSNLSRVIRLFTRAEFNHISIALSSDLEPMWSFGRKYPYNPFCGGFVKEHLREGTFYRFPKTRCAVYSLEVSDEQYAAIRAQLEAMYRERALYRYNFYGLCLAAVRIDQSFEKRFYCSQFFKSLFIKVRIPGAECLPKIAEPCHFAELPNVAPVYRGFLKEYDTP
ncbi:MAG: hypothetical protein IKD18_06000 [Clostridia bacterium]|nr:hypothetical protein [Clostridia bacterium]